MKSAFNEFDRIIPHYIIGGLVVVFLGCIAIGIGLNLVSIYLERLIISDYLSKDLPMMRDSLAPIDTTVGAYPRLQEAMEDQAELYTQPDTDEFGIQKAVYLEALLRAECYRQQSQRSIDEKHLEQAKASIRSLAICLDIASRFSFTKLEPKDRSTLREASYHLLSENEAEELEKQLERLLPKLEVVRQEAFGSRSQAASHLGAKRQNSKHRLTVYRKQGH